MKKNWYVPVVMLLLTVAACAEKKKAPATGSEMAFATFADFFPAGKPTFTYGDSLFPKTENDSVKISNEMYHRFVPDSALLADAPPQEKPKFYPVIRLQNAGETYLLTRAVTTQKKLLYITAFDKTNKFIATLPVIRNSRNNRASHTIIIDDNFNIVRKTSFRNESGTLISGMDVYVLNTAARKFMLVMTDSLGDGFTELVNPIDTLPKTKKFTGDYGTGKNNLVSLRDDNRTDKLSMFLHLENEDKGCLGELKGEVTFRTGDTAEYRVPGDACVIQFAFSKNKVTLAELGGCGSRLGNMACRFDGVYPLKKPAQKTEPKSGKNTATGKK